MKTRLIDPPRPPEKIAPAEKICTSCGGDPQPISAFYPNKNYRDGYTTICKTCHAVYHAAYVRDHRKEHAKYERAWRRNNPDKARAIRKRSDRVKAKNPVYQAKRRELSHRRELRLTEERRKPLLAALTSGMTVADAAIALDVSTARIGQLIRAGRLASTKVGRRQVVSRLSVEALVAERTS